MLLNEVEGQIHEDVAAKLSWDKETLHVQSEIIYGRMKTSKCITE